MKKLWDKTATTQTVQYQRCAIIVLILIVIMHSAALYYYMNTGGLPENTEIPLYVQRELLENGFVDFGKGVDGDWDYILFVFPYAIRSQVRVKNVRRLERLNQILYHDGAVLLLFCKDGVAEKYCYLTEDIVTFDFEPGTSSRPHRVERAEAKFKTVPTDAEIPFHLTLQQGDS